ncbi:uncharacterized protein LOC132628746 [Lycium barbarum]|uniref:uncharacterized protein LOC132628746 n=1 Tax=Lycium barbarum TaxID=112863 RepID=UPI00293EC0D5|nr:uncharacterized protein LOC132628746 [Lycium barbarum]
MKEHQSSANKVVRRKDRTEWIMDLHAKFMDVVQQLGEGRCFPTEILRVMNVPGLTRGQVESHLQVRDPQVVLNKEVALQILGQEESSTQQQVYRPQHQVNSQYISIDNPFNNPFLLAKNNNADWLQQQHGPLFEMLGSQGLRSPISGSTYYRPELEFNGGYHHAQNYYDLNVNAANEATYSGSAMMSGTNIENTTINELGAANANFHEYLGEPNISEPSNIIATSHASDNEGSDSNDRENYDVYLDFNNMDYLF